MSAPNPHDEGPHHDGVLQAEYALGLLDGAELHAAHARAAADPAFAQGVEAWSTRFAALALPLAAESPSPAAWSAIERRLDGAGTVVELDLRRRLSRWRAAAASALAVAAALAVLVMLPRQQPPTPAPVLTARLAGATGPVAFVAVLDPSRHEIVLTPAAVTAAAGRSPELWLIPAGGKPVPLGLAAFAAPVRLAAANVASSPSGVLAISIEPLGGSPTGQPTGPVIATGKLERL